MKLLVLFLFFLHCTTTFAQPPTQSPAAPATPAAPAPAPSGPTNITAILEKGGQFSTLIKLLKSTQVGDQINNQLNNSNGGLTVFAPTDNAFSSLSSGTLNSLNDEQKVQLVQFHVVATQLTSSQFQTVSNPLRTQAGNSDPRSFPLNVTTSGNNVNITTGVVNATLANTIYTDSHLAVYQVDQVLLPVALFGPQAPAPSPAEAKKQAASSVTDSPQSSNDSSDDTSGAVALFYNALSVKAVGVGMAVFAVFSMSA